MRAPARWLLAAAMSWAPVSSSVAREIPRAHLLAVPFLSQTEDLCGGAAAAMVLRYWGARTVEPQDFASLVRADLHGISTTELARDLQRRGWQAYALAASSTNVEHHLQQGRPLLALLEVRPARYHYVVIVGWTANDVIYHDPADRPFRRVPRRVFEEKWARADHWMMLILPSPGSAPTYRTNEHGVGTRGAAETASRNTGHGAANECADSVTHAVTLSESGQYSAAAVALKKAHEECPASAAPLTELASLLLLQHQYGEAARVAERAVAQPDADRHSWDVLGTCLFLLHRPDRALDAWNHAGRPAVDLIRIDGLDRTRYGVVTTALSLDSGALLTSQDLTRARRRLASIPSLAASRLDYMPVGNGVTNVEAGVLERRFMPSGPLAFAALGARALAEREAGWTVVSPTRNGETITAVWRWWEGRPRVGVDARIPLYETRLKAVLNLAGSIEEQQYVGFAGAGAEAVVRERRRSASIMLSDWTSGGIRWELRLGLDRWEHHGTFPRVGAGLEARLADDRVALLAGADAWPGGGFGDLASGIRWRTTTDDDKAAILLSAGAVAASKQAPPDLWPGAGTGHARPYLLRGHSLLDRNGAIDSPAFGRQLVHSTAEVRLPLASSGLLRLTGTAFVDAARAWDGPRADRGLADAGIGLRLGVASEGTLRLDLAHGLSDGANALSVGWESSWPRWH